MYTTVRTWLKFTQQNKRTKCMVVAFAGCNASGINTILSIVTLLLLHWCKQHNTVLLLLKWWRKWTEHKDMDKCVPCTRRTSILMQRNENEERKTTEEKNQIKLKKKITTITTTTTLAMFLHCECFASQDVCRQSEPMSRCSLHIAYKSNLSPKACHTSCTIGGCVVFAVVVVVVAVCCLWLQSQSKRCGNILFKQTLKIKCINKFIDTNFRLFNQTLLPDWVNNACKYENDVDTYTQLQLQLNTHRI